MWYMNDVTCICGNGIFAIIDKFFQGNGVNNGNLSNAHEAAICVSAVKSYFKTFKHAVYYGNLLKGIQSWNDYNWNPFMNCRNY